LEDFNSSLGRLIGQWRRNAGMSQADLAELLGNQQTSISKLENGSKRITVAELSQILCACGLTFGVVCNDLDGLFVHESQPLWERVNE
jgi:DNA-binding helix-turn-helix protein